MSTTPGEQCVWPLTFNKKISLLKIEGLVPGASLDVYTKYFFDGFWGEGGEKSLLWN